MNDTPTPPPYPGTDENLQLLEAISRNPDTAHLLAAIAEGGDPGELLRGHYAGLLSTDDEPSPANGTSGASPCSPATAEEPREPEYPEEEPAVPREAAPAMYQPDIEIPEERIRTPYPNFLSHLSEGFWS